MECILRPGGCLLIGLEEAGRTESPDFPEFLALIVVEHSSRLVVVLGHPCPAVPHAALDAVGEVLSTHLELVSPGEGEFPALGLEGSVIAFRRGITECGRDFRTVDIEVCGVPYIIVP